VGLASPGFSKEVVRLRGNRDLLARRRHRHGHHGAAST
jgi:hypothetical protein